MSEGQTIGADSTQADETALFADLGILDDTPTQSEADSGAGTVTAEAEKQQTAVDDGLLQNANVKQTNNEGEEAVEAKATPKPEKVSKNYRKIAKQRNKYKAKVEQLEQEVERMRGGAQSQDLDDLDVDDDMDGDITEREVLRIVEERETERKERESFFTKHPAANAKKDAIMEMKKTYPEFSYDAVAGLVDRSIFSASQSSTPEPIDMSGSISPNHNQGVGNNKSATEAAMAQFEKSKGGFLDAIFQ